MNLDLLTPTACDLVEAVMHTAPFLAEAQRIGCHIRVIEVPDSDDIVVHFDYLGTTQETSEKLGDLVADAMQALGFEFSGQAGPTGGGIIGCVTYSGGEYSRYQLIVKPVEVVDTAVFFERIATGDENYVVLFDDERNGNQPLEDQLTKAARARGFNLVEDEDGDLVLAAAAE